MGVHSENLQFTSYNIGGIADHRMILYDAGIGFEFRNLKNADFNEKFSKLDFEKIEG